MDTAPKKHEYKLGKYTFQNPYEITTAVDDAVSDIFLYNYLTNVNLSSSYLEKVELILEFLKIEKIFQNVEVKDISAKNCAAKFMGESGYVVLVDFLIIQLTSGHNNKYEIYEAFKKFNEYVSVFEIVL